MWLELRRIGWRKKGGPTWAGQGGGDERAGGWVTRAARRVGMSGFVCGGCADCCDCCELCDEKTKKKDAD